MGNSSLETGSVRMWMLINAKGYTLDDRGSTFDAVAVENGRIVAVGTRHELSLQLGHRVAKTLDVAGATVVPGFVDSHLHVSGVGEQALCLDLSGVRSRQEMLERVEQYASQLTPGAWVLGRGWDDNRFVDKTLPTLDELDAAAGGRPVLLTRVCFHAYLTNRVALRLAGVDDSAADPPDGKYGRDEQGRLNGLLYENASLAVRAAIPPWSLADWHAAFRAGMEAALKAGITAVHTDDVRSLQSFAAVWNLYHRLIREDGVHLRVHELVDWSYLDECLRAAGDLPPEDEWLERGAAKLFSDGAFGGRTAWLSADYSDAPGWRGTPMYSREELAERVRVAHEKGFAAAVHAIGDAGLEETVAAFAAAPPVGQRDRLIHAELVRPDLVECIAELGDRVVVDIQPRFTVSDFPWLQDRLGPERVRYACAWRTLKEAGLRLAGGSDAPIEPIAPLLGMHAAVARKPPHAEGSGYGMEQALTPEEAVRLFTRDACFANASEHHKGVIAPGWLADFTVVDRDIVKSADVDDFLAANVLYTIVGGEVAWAADGSAVEWSA